MAFGMLFITGDPTEVILRDAADHMTVEQIQARLANAETLVAAVESSVAEVGLPWDEWDEVDRLGFVGVIVLHAELGVPIPEDWRDRAVAWLRDETIDWDEATARKLRRHKEIERLTGQPEG